MLVRLGLIAAMVLGVCVSAFAELTPKALETDEFVSGAYIAGNVIIAGQPKSKAGLEDLKLQGVSLVVNLRTPREMAAEDHPLPNEQKIVESLGMQYANLPSGGSSHPYSPETVTQLFELIDATDGRVLLHCRSGRRASHLWVAYLVKHRGLSLDEAVKLGKQANLGSTPLEDFLDQKVEYQLAP